MKTTRSHLFTPNKEWTLENYITDCPEKNISLTKELFLNQFRDIDCLIIKSTVGNGGTHLLQGIYHQLKNDDKKIIFFWGDKLFCEFKTYFEDSAISSLNELFYQNKFILIDGLSSFYTEKKHFIKWFETIFSESIIQGSKFIINIPVFLASKTEVCDTPPFFLRNIRSQTIISDRPSQESIFQIISKVFADENIHPPLDILKYISEQKISSVRELEGLCITIIANCHLEKINIEQMNPQELDKLKKRIDNWTK